MTRLTDSRLDAIHKWAQRFDATFVVDNLEILAMVQELQLLRKTVEEQRLVLNLIDQRMGVADATCDEPGISISEAARRELADMGVIEYQYKTGGAE
jgi:hypothetical protein